MSTRRANALIIGGGLVGLATAQALAREGVDCTHIAPPAPPDRRTSALMQPSTEFLGEIGLFEQPHDLGTPLKRIRIIDATKRLLRAPEALFDSHEAGLECFGWNFANARMADRFSELAGKHTNLRRIEASAKEISRTGPDWEVTLDNGVRISAPLLIGADGKNSLVRKSAGIGVTEHKFAQSALVADLELARSLDGESVEFHYPNGPFTLVPAGGNRANLVWIDDAATLARTRDAKKDEIEELLASRAQRLFGTITLASPTFVFPLSTLQATIAGADGVVLVGESAHAFPPIGAQGLNLGLRDVESLVRAISSCPADNAGWAQQVGTAYAQERATDIRRTGQFVDTLFRSLLSEFLPSQLLRAGGLWALKLSPQLRDRAFNLGMGAQNQS